MSPLSDYSEMARIMAATVYSLQNEITDTLSEIDGRSFKQETWERSRGGGGRTRVLENGSIFEKAGVNSSEVFGTLQGEEPKMFANMLSRAKIECMPDKNDTFFATGISLVLHPKNPYIPTIHANYRYFELKTKNKTLWWFGGGTDLTPYYINKEDIKAFHKAYHTTCNLFDPSYYPKFKAHCDTYFYLPHRQESRGVGGIFFDYLRTPSKEACYQFAKACGHTFLPAYLPLVKKHRSHPYTEKELAWQHYRRGRYVEFNLLYDRGTLFGLKTKGRTESILMSLPAKVSWVYNYSPHEGSPESELLALIKKPQDWI